MSIVKLISKPPKFKPGKYGAPNKPPSWWPKNKPHEWPDAWPWKVDAIEKAAGMRIKSKFAWDNCVHGLIPKKETLVGWHRGGNYFHYMQKPDKNTLRHFTMAGPFGQAGPEPYKAGDKFYGAVHEFTNKDAKERLSKFHEIYKFKNPESAKRFREQLKEFDK